MTNPATVSRMARDLYSAEKKWERKEIVQAYIDEAEDMGFRLPETIMVGLMLMLVDRERR